MSWPMIVQAVQGLAVTSGVTLPTTDLIARLTAKTGVTTGATFGWADQVGSADATQTVALDQPTYTASTSVDFDGADHWLDWTGLTLGTSWTVFIRIDTTGTPATGTIRLLSNASVEFYHRRIGSTELKVGATAVSGTHVDGDQLYTIQCNAASGLATIWRDGVDLTSGGVAVTPTAVTGDVSLMGRYSNGNNPGFGSLSEVLAYGAALDSTARASVRAYMAAEWP